MKCTKNPSSLNPTILSGDAEEATALLEKPNEPLWYLAYGSNLYSTVFKGRRGIKPLEERHVIVEGLELTFDLPGLPYIEPRFANCRFPSESTLSEKGTDGRRDWDLNGPWSGKGALIGVAYLVTPADFARVIATEGGGSGYKMVSVTAQVFKSITKPGEGSSHVVFTGEMVHAFTLLASSEETRKNAGQPSPRYLSLIRKGAEEHSLPPGYLKYLSSLTPYTAATFRQKAGRAVSLMTWVPPMLTLAVLGLALAHEDGSSPQWLTDTRQRVVNCIWSSYDGIMRKSFGDGERTRGTRAG